MTSLSNWAMALAVAALVAGASEARAAEGDVGTGSFTSDHCTHDCGVSAANPGGIVTVTDLGGGTGGGTGTLNFSIQLSPGYQFINGGFDASFGFNLIDNPTITYTNVVPPLGTSWSVPGGNPQDAGHLHMDGTGHFEYGLDGIGNGGSDPLGSLLSFSISGINLDIFDLLETGDQNQFMAADVISPRGATGGIDLSVTPHITPFCTTPPCDVVVPEPGSFVLAGTGIVGIAGVIWWRRRRYDDSEAFA